MVSLIAIGLKSFLNSFSDEHENAMVDWASSEIIIARNRGQNKVNKNCKIRSWIGIPSIDLLSFIEKYIKYEMNIGVVLS